MVQIKICGLTQPDDAELAAFLGAFALGFIFTPLSKRYNPEESWPMIRQLTGNWLKVGVFQDQKTEFIRKVTEKTGLDRIQLHGKETIQQIEELSIPVWKAISLDEALSGDFPESDRIEYYLVDSSHGNQRGGTGLPFNWNQIPEIRLPKPFLIAGGINPENVGQLVQLPGVTMIDVSSGVEESPGIKDKQKLKKLFQGANR